MPEGGRLAIEAANVEIPPGEEAPQGIQPGAYVMLQITDSGCGMDEETLSRIYEPFFTTKEQGRGTGLGLSTVYGVVAQSGGTISAHSQPGLGTSFRILFPLVTAEADPAVKSDESLPTGGNETILLVEDEELVRDLTRTILTTYGYKILEASEGTAALRLCQSYQGPIHLMLSDVVMPGLNGPELYEKALPLHGEMAVLLMSGYTGMREPGKGRIGPDQPYLAKPFTPVVLARKVREVLGAARQATIAPKATQRAGVASAAAASHHPLPDPLEVPASEAEEEFVLSLDTIDGL
jgi:CheY-like chemotaxis protein